MSSKHDQQTSSAPTEASTRPSYPTSQPISCSDLSGVSINSENTTFFNCNFEDLNDPKALLCPVIESSYFFKEESKAKIN